MVYCQFFFPLLKDIWANTVICFHAEFYMRISTEYHFHVYDEYDAIARKQSANLTIMTGKEENT